MSRCANNILYIYIYVRFSARNFPPPPTRGLLARKASAVVNAMLGWDSLLSIYKRVPDAATGEMILVRRPELGGLESHINASIR